MITEEHDDSKAKTISLYCHYCFANTESECYCNRIQGYDANTGLPIVAIFQSEWDAYISHKKDYTPIDSDTQYCLVGDDVECTIPEEIIQYLASLGDTPTASIRREGYAEKYNIPTSVIDTLVFRLIDGNEPV
jgi:hypothetical protein